jgi:hypothetical protein
MGYIYRRRGEATMNFLRVGNPQLRQKVRSNALQEHLVLIRSAFERTSMVDWWVSNPPVLRTGFDYSGHVVFKLRKHKVLYGLHHNIW